MPDRNLPGRDEGVMPRTVATRNPIIRDVGARGVSTQSPSAVNSPTQAEIDEITRRTQQNATCFLARAGAPTTEEIRRMCGIHVDGDGDPEVDTTNRSDSPGALYGTDNPFEILADLALRLFPGDADNTPQTTYVPVVGSSGGGGSSMIILLVIVAIGGGAYYFYKKRGNNAG